SYANTSRRIVAVVLKHLLTELATEQRQLRETTALATASLARDAPKQPHAHGVTTQSPRAQRRSATVNEPMVVVLCDGETTESEISNEARRVGSIRTETTNEESTRERASEADQLQRTTIAAVNESA